MRQFQVLSSGAGYLRAGSGGHCGRHSQRSRRLAKNLSSAGVQRGVEGGWGAVVAKSVCNVQLFANVKRSARTDRLFSSFVNDFLVALRLDSRTYFL